MATLVSPGVDIVIKDEDPSEITMFTPTSRMIWVTFDKEGIHKYPAALTDPNLATGREDDVSFLGYPHRHIFKFKVWISVVHHDRDIEFIQFKRWLEKLYTEKTLELDFKSCEMIAEDLYFEISAKYPNRSVWIEVSEDGENGALIKWDLVLEAKNDLIIHNGPELADAIYNDAIIESLRKFGDDVNAIK